jgi:hypothetical protein
VFQHTFDFDFIKVTPSSNYCVAGYGAETSWAGNQEGTRTYEHRIIKSPEDWERLKPLDPNEGLLGEVIKANETIGQSVREEVPRGQSRPEYHHRVYHSLYRGAEANGSRRYISGLAARHV